jgi:uncharacterized OB-fold protein
MNDIAYDKPLPEPTLDSQPYWDALKEHRLVLQRCARCKKVRHYPRPVCDACYSMECDWIEATGKGRVHSWTVSHHAFHPGFKGELPYVEVTVDLDEGVRMQSRLIDAAAEDVTIGMAVDVVFEDVTSETTLALFRAADAGP